MRVKTGFLKVFKSSGDSRPLLDIGGNSLHDEEPSPFDAPTSLLSSNNEVENSNDGDDDDEFAIDHGPSPSNMGMDSGHDTTFAQWNNAKGDVHVGELHTKPTSGTDAFTQQESSRRGLFGTRKKGSTGTHEACDSDSSSVQDDDGMHFEAAVTTTSSDDDANTFVQFTLVEPVAPALDPLKDLGAVQEDEEDNAIPDFFQSMDSQFEQNLVETNTQQQSKLPVKSDHGVSVASQTVDIRPSRPRLSNVGKSASSRSLAEHLEKDKPTVDEEVRRVLNIKGSRPGLGGRKKSDRNLRKDDAPERQESRRGLMKKAMSERTFGSPSTPLASGNGALAGVSAHGPTEFKGNGQVSLTRQKSKGTPVTSHRKGRSGNGDKRKQMSKSKSAMGVTERGRGSSTLSYGDAMTAVLEKPSGDIEDERSSLDKLKPPSQHNCDEKPITIDKLKPPSQHNRGETSDSIPTSTAISPPTTPTKEQNRHVHSSPETNEELRTASLDSPRSNEQKEKGGTAESPNSAMSRRNRGSVPKSPEKTPSRRSRLLANKNGSYTPEKTKEGLTREKSNADTDNRLPSAPISPKRPRSPKEKKGMKNPSNATKKDSDMDGPRSEDPDETSLPSSIPEMSQMMIGEQQLLKSSSPRTVDDDDLVELTDGETEGGNESDKSITQKRDGSRNVMVSPERGEMTKDFAKDSVTHLSNPSGQEQEEQQSLLRKRLEKAMVRLEDARRLVLSLEHEVAELTQQLKKSEDFAGQ